MAAGTPSDGEAGAPLPATEYDVRAQAARPVLAAILAAADALPPGEPRTLLLYLVEDDRLFDPGLDFRGWVKACRIPEAVGRDLFRAALGVSPRVFLEEARLEVAMGMLAASDLFALAIAQVVGLDERTFERAFRASTGTTPGACRPWLRQLHTGLGNPGLAVLNWDVLVRLGEGTAPEWVFRAVTRLLLRRYVEHLVEPDAGVLADLEKRLAAEVWEERLAPEPSREAVEACRAYFQTTAFEDLLAEKGWPPAEALPR